MLPRTIQGCGELTGKVGGGREGEAQGSQALLAQQGLSWLRSHRGNRVTAQRRPFHTHPWSPLRWPRVSAALQRGPSVLAFYFNVKFLFLNQTFF